MSNLDGREVLYAKTHSSIFITGLADVGPTFTADDTQSKLKNQKMVIAGNFLMVTGTAALTKKPFEIAIPLSNVSHMSLKAL